MYLKRLEILGFKTFANHTVLEFRPGITAIVGPNGSGKSNIADAVRWVLGEQSYAALRSKRSEDIIFSGAGRRAPAGFAEVSLTIDNSDRLLPLPYHEVTFTRRYTRSGASEYLINRSRVRLRDLHEAIGPLGSSYTIINQGLVDAALTLRPDERRRLFEDAAEIGTFTARKAEAESRLRETNANMERCADILGELEPRMRSLKRQASLARTHRELSGELRALLEQYYAKQWRAAQQHAQAAAQAAHAASAEVEARRSAQAAATTELRAQREAMRELRERLAQLHHQSSQLHRRAEVLQRDLAVSGERLAALNRSEEEAQRRQGELVLRRDEVQRERASIDARLASAEARLQQAQAVIADQQAALAQHQDERRATRARLNTAQRDELAASAALNALQQRIAQLAARRAALEHEAAGQAEALAEAEQQLAARRAALAEAEQQLAAAQAARQAAAEAEEHARAQQAVLRDQRAQAEEAIAAVRRALADLEARQESLARLQRSYAGTYAGVKAAMQWAEAERRQGFALVSSLLHSPAELETAVEVALGGRLQNIVVARWADAEDAITALKRSGAGRATFLPLDTIHRNERSSATSHPARITQDASVLGVAAELVDYDEPYRSVVWYLLGRTLVVRDLATARDQVRNLPGGWTIVTLAGEQVNSGGALTGGAQIKEAGVLRRARELRELPERIAAVQRDIATQTETRADLEAQLRDSERATREAAAQRHHAAQDEEARREAEAQRRRAAAQAETALDAQRRRQAQLSADVQALDVQTATLANEQAALAEHERAAQVHLAELRAAAQRDDEQERAAQAHLIELRAALAEIEGELRADRALRDSYAQQLAQLEAQQAASAERIAEIQRERAATEAASAELHTAHTALLAQIDELRAHVTPAEAELERLEAASVALEQRDASLTAALLASETAHGRALVEAQRARDRVETLWERAAGDDIDIEAIVGQQQSDDAAVSIANDPNALHATILQLKSRIARLGAINPLALEEYEEESKRHEFLSDQLADLRSAAESLQLLIGDLDSAMHARFATTFSAIAAAFEKSFERLFGGGQASLVLTNGSAELNGNGAHDPHLDALGVEIMARPPGKRQQALSLLSGGERALTATALLFAILHVNPSPFCLLDEVDAALDEANVGRFRSLLTDMTDETQFILVTHNRGTIEAADTIYGVSMDDHGVSRVLSLRLEELVEA